MLLKLQYDKRFLIHLIVGLFVILNGINLTRTCLIDWDEGVFALQGEWIETIGAEGKPFNFQSPPLYQTLIAFLFKLLGHKDFILPLLSIIFSVLTIYLVFYLVKTLYSIEEGLYAVILFVTTEFFLFFSKSGLSDATFLFLFTASVVFFVKGIEHNRTKDFLLTGFFTALALYTKYSAAPLLFMFFIIGLLTRRRTRKNWYIFPIILPIIVFCPYVYLFTKFVHLPEIGSRHISILGINHIKYLIYLITFAPVPLILSCLYATFSFRNTKKWDIYFIIFIVVYYVILGFYHPYFRLLYPIIPFISILGSRFIVRTKQYKPYILLFSIILSMILGFKTMTYKTTVPKRIGQSTDFHVQKNDIHYIYTVVPPNVYFYVDGSIVVSVNHPWAKIGKKFPVLLQKKKIIYPDNNELLSQNKVLLIHATAFDSVKQKNIELYTRGTLLESLEFLDAPVYYKDIYNPQRNFDQIYEIYLFDKVTLEQYIADLWNLGFNRQVEVIVRK